jgi:hypothetical protein
MKDSRVDPSALSNYAIQRACELGHSDIVAELLLDPRVDPTVPSPTNITCYYVPPIQLAAEAGHWRVVRVLLQVRQIHIKISPTHGNIIFHNIIFSPLNFFSKFS